MPPFPRREVLLWLTLSALLPGCAAPGEDLPLLPSPNIADYRLGPGDQLKLTTFGEEQLTGEFRVNASGMVALPLLGGVRALGLTTAEFGAAIEDGLRKGGLYRQPSVSVEVIAYRPIYVMGEVNKPGEYDYKPGMTVQSAVAVAGGYTYRAIEDYAGVVRNTSGHGVEGRAERQGYIQPGDVVTVYGRQF